MQVASFAIVYTQFYRLLNDIFTSECEVCRGTGRIICKHCRGTKTLRARPGVFTIQRLQVVDRDPADVCAPPTLPASAPPARPAWARRLSAQACSCSPALRVCTASPLPASPPPARPARTRRLSAQARSCGPALRTATCLNLAEAPLSPALPGRAGCASLLARVSCRSRAAAPAGAARDSSPSRRSRRRRPRSRLS